MPTVVVTKTVCAFCYKSSCDGGLWRFVRCVEDEAGESDPKTWPVENQTTCTLKSRRAKFLKGKKVGDTVELRYSNWSPPATVWVSKIKD